MSALLRERVAKQPTGWAWIPALFLWLVLGTGCSTYQKTWKQAAADPMASTGIQGAWQGTWESVRNGHQGQLKCVVRPTQDPNIFQFHYWATFWKVFRATYEVEKKVVASNGVWRIQGEKNLGRLAGGLYQYQGETDGQELRATYKSAGDEGVFLLSRPIAP